MNENSNHSPTPPAVWRDRSQELREAEWKAHQDCLQAAQHILQHIRGRKGTVSDLTKLLDLASKLGRLATGMATEQVEHAWSQYHDPRFIAEIEAEVDRVFGKPINIQSEPIPNDCSSRGNEALTKKQNVELEHAVSESNDMRSEQNRAPAISLSPGAAETKSLAAHGAGLGQGEGQTAPLRLCVENRQT